MVSHQNYSQFMQDEDERYLNLCGKIKRRIEWMRDAAQEFSDPPAFGGSSSSTDMTSRMRVVHSIVRSTRSDLSRLHNLATLDYLNEAEKSKRQQMCRALSAALHHALKAIELRASRGLGSTTTGSRRPSSMSQSSMTSAKQSLGAVGGNEFVRVEISDASVSGENTDLEEQANLLTSLQRDIEHIAQMQRDFSSIVAAGTEDLAQIEASASTALLQVTDAHAQLTVASESESSRRFTLLVVIGVVILALTIAALVMFL